MPIANIKSVINNGILCYHKAENILNHSSIAMNDVQAIREYVIVYGKSLHDYANMYFSFRNPMMYKRRMQAENLCVLAIDNKVLDIPECIVTDQNAACRTVRFYDASNGIESIDFNKVFADNWIDDDIYETSLHKKIKCAEILIPDSISYDYIIGAYVLNETSKIELIQKGFTKDIIIKPSIFFR